jgi:hypothetical protein
LLNLRRVRPKRSFFSVDQSLFSTRPYRVHHFDDSLIRSSRLSIGATLMCGPQIGLVM